MTCAGLRATERRFSGGLDLVGGIDITVLTRILRERGAAIPDGYVTPGDRAGGIYAGANLHHLGGVVGSAIRNSMSRFGFPAVLVSERGGQYWMLRQDYVDLCRALGDPLPSEGSSSTARYSSTTPLLIGGAVLAGLWFFSRSASAGRGDLRSLPRSRRPRKPTVAVIRVDGQVYDAAEWNTPTQAWRWADGIRRGLARGRIPHPDVRGRVAPERIKVTLETLE